MGCRVPHMVIEHSDVNETDYEQAVNSLCDLYSFSPAGNADDAAELTQETFARLLVKGGQLRDQLKSRAGCSPRLSNLPGLENAGNIAAALLEIASVEDELLPVSTGDGRRRTRQ